MTRSQCDKCFWSSDCEDTQRCKEYGYDCWKFRDKGNKFDVVNSEPEKNGSALYMNGGSNN